MVARTAIAELPGDAEEWVLTGMGFLLPAAYIAIRAGVLGVISFVFAFFSAVFLTIGYFKAVVERGGDHE